MKVLGNMQLITNEISVINNNLPDGEFSCNPQVTKDIIEVDEQHKAVQLTLEIKDTEEHHFPLNIRIQLTGIFEIAGIPENSLDDFLNIQAVSIIFPYVRTMLSSITSTAMVPPIILPIINVRELFTES